MSNKLQLLKSLQEWQQELPVSFQQFLPTVLAAAPASSNTVVKVTPVNWYNAARCEMYPPFRAISKILDIQQLAHE
jgi:hypothetical protein